MSQPIKKVISQVYELEGLLLLIQNHGENTDPFIYEMVREKSNTVAELVSALSPDIFSKQAEIITGVSVEKQDETNESKIEDAELTSINLSEFDGVILGADNSYDLDDNLTEESSEEIVEDNEIEVEIIYDENQSDTETTISVETEGTELEVESEEGIENIEGIEDIDIIEESSVEITEEIIEKPITNPTTSTDFKSVRKAFSLNDRFRYKRELFANSDVEMNNTLDLVDTMETFAEAEEYFYNDLQWDKESFEVIDFMFIIRNHF